MSRCNLEQQTSELEYKNELKPDVVNYTTMMNGFYKVRKVYLAEMFLQKMQKRALYNSLKFEENINQPELT